MKFITGVYYWFLSNLLQCTCESILKSRRQEEGQQAYFLYAFMIIAIRATADVVKALGIEKSLKLVEVSSLLRKKEGEGKKN